MSKILIISILILCIFKECKSQSNQLPIGTIDEYYIGGKGEYYNTFRSKINYPKELNKEDVNGNIYFQIYIDTIGNVDSVKIIRGLHHLIDKEIEKKILLTNGKWKPYYLNGEKVKYSVYDIVTIYSYY